MTSAPRTHAWRDVLLGSRGWAGPLAGAVAAGLLLASFDLFGSSYWAEHPMLAQALGGLILFIQGGLLLPRFLSYSDEQRQRKVSRVAYASLAQATNDAGRRLLALLNGADLFALGIEAEDREGGATIASVNRERTRLESHGFDASFADTGWIWTIDRPALDGRLRVLLTDPEFVRVLYRRVSRVRRDLHDAAAVWAPTMFSDAERTEDLEAFRELAWDCQQLQGALRKSGVLLADQPGWLPSQELSDEVSTAFWAAITRHDEIRKVFNERGAREPGPPVAPASPSASA
jgi:hypothetical protein